MIPSFTVVLIMLACFGPLVFYRPWIGVVGVLLFQLFLASGSEGITTVEIVYSLLFFMTLYAWLIKYFVLARLRFPKSPLIPAVVVFILYCMISVVFAVSKDIFVLHWLRQWHTFGSLLLIFPIITEFRDVRRLKILISVLLLSGAIIALEGIYRSFIGGGVITFGPTGIASTTYIWSTFVIMGLLGCLRAARWRLILLMLLAVNLFRFVIEIRRLPIAIFLLGLGVILWFTFIQRRANANVKITYFTAFFGIVVLGVLIWLWTPNFVSTLGERYINRLSSWPVERGLVSRYLRIKAVLPDFVESPLVGQGFGYNFGKPLIISMPRWGVREVGKVHNLYIYLLSRSGLIGLGLYLWFLGALFKEGRFVLIKADRDFEKGVALGLFAGCISIAVFAMFSARFSRIEVQSFLAVAGGIFVLLRGKRVLNGGKTEK